MQAMTTFHQSPLGHQLATPFQYSKSSAGLCRALATLVTHLCAILFQRQTICMRH